MPVLIQFIIFIYGHMIKTLNEFWANQLESNYSEQTTQTKI